MLALVNGTRRCLVTERKIRVFRTRVESIAQASIAVGKILIALLYWNVGIENTNLSGDKSWRSFS